MSTPYSQSNKPQKHNTASTTSNRTTASKWGSLLQGAVAGIESKLDNILAEDGASTSGGSGGSKGTTDRSSRGGTEGKKSEGGQDADIYTETSISSSLSRAGSSASERGTRQQEPLKPHPEKDRLQQRLAKALTKGSSENSTESRKNLAQASRSSSPSTLQADRSQISISNLSNAETSTLADGFIGVENNSNGATETDSLSKEAGAGDIKEGGPSIPPTSLATPQTSELLSVRSSAELLHNTVGSDLPQVDASRAPTALYDEATVTRIRKLHEDDSKARQEEIHTHLERIDALEAKLQYFTKSAAEAAQRAASQAPVGSLERKLAEKEKQLALLMEEGQKLSKTELKHLTAIKRLQAKALEDEKLRTELKRKLESAESASADAAQTLKRAQGLEKQTNEKRKKLDRLEVDLQSIKAERDSLKAITEVLKKQLAEADRRTEASEKKAHSDALASEKNLISSLKEEIDDMRIEKKLKKDRAKAEMRDVRAEVKMKQDRSTVLESELRGEIMNLEQKLEVFRSRTEEVSSSSTADSHAKLLRQLERLQSQYSLASENWQGIEGTLTARATALERERDEVTRRETELRKRTKDLISQSRNFEEELELVKEKSNTLESEVLEERAQAEKLKSSLSETKLALADYHRQHNILQKTMDSVIERRLGEEKNKWQAASSIQIDTRSPLPESPTSSHHRKQLKDETMGATKRNTSFARGVDFRLSNLDSSLSRRSSYQFRSPGPETPNTLDPYTAFSPTAGSYQIGRPASQTPSVIAKPTDPEDALDTSMSQTHTAADLISVGTTGAGPSVQLVERMSAAVRQLECEKAAAKEEHARLISQRDEARAEVVTLMGEVENKADTEKKIKSLEEDLLKTNGRYQTTLEMLGEKSERVDELTNDVADLKQIYKDLVEAKTG